jgi:hypothetical protein
LPGLLARWDLRGIFYLDTFLFVALTVGSWWERVTRAAAPEKGAVASGERLG